jgi:hypothetical protein
VLGQPEVFGFLPRLERALIGVLFALSLTRCCGGAFTTTAMARSKRCHASGANSISADLRLLAMSETTEYLNDLRHLYCSLMEEVKQRSAIIANTLEGHNPYPAFAALEICYLQLRMICECIALGCVAAHGDIAAPKGGKLTKAYAADWILNGLERLHPNFYPVPGNAIRVAGSHFRLEPLTEAFLTKKDLLALYAECGGILHRGTVRTIRKKFAAPDFEAVSVHYAKIIRLLNEHQIRLSDPDQVFVVTMKSPPNDVVRALLMSAKAAV